MTDLLSHSFDQTKVWSAHSIIQASVLATQAFQDEIEGISDEMKAGFGPNSRYSMFSFRSNCALTSIFVVGVLAMGTLLPLESVSSVARRPVT